MNVDFYLKFMNVCAIIRNILEFILSVVQWLHDFVDCCSDHCATAIIIPVSYELNRNDAESAQWYSAEPAQSSSDFLVKT